MHNPPESAAIVDSLLVKYLRHSVRRATALLVATGVLAVAGAASGQAPPAALPPLKKAPGAKVEAAHEAPVKGEMSAEARAQRGVVTIERAGQPLALGSVLMGDGRILTALSPLG